MKTLTAIAIIVSAASANAQNMPCAPEEQMAQLLQEQRGQSLALTASPQYPREGVQMQFFVNPATNEWTLLAVGPQGSCVVTYGTDWLYGPQGEAT